MLGGALETGTCAAALKTRRAPVTEVIKAANLAAVAGVTREVQKISASLTVPFTLAKKD
jgi:hypothetical protein